MKTNIKPTIKNCCFMIVVLFLLFSARSVFALSQGDDIYLQECHSRSTILISQSLSTDLGLTSLHEAAIQGDTAQVNALIAQGVNVDVLDNNRRTSLHWAASLGYTDVIELLISKGANVDAPCGFGTTPLYQASGNMHYEAVKLLISKGAKVNIGDENDFTPLHTVVSAPANATEEANRIKITQFLISKGANVNAKNIYDVTPLRAAKNCEKPNQSVIDLLIQNGAVLE